MSREVTFDTICIVLEEYQGDRIEDIADQMMASLSLLGDDLLDHLDPPVGLRHWLESHGLSLVVTHSPTPPAVWGAIDGSDDEEEEEEADLKEELGGEQPLLQVGDSVEYRTAPSGPHNQCLIGSGRIKAIHHAHDTGSNIVIVETGQGAPEVWLDSHMDFIRPVGAP